MINKIIFLTKRFKLSLFGYDLIYQKLSNTIYIIDINYFPGFKNVPNLQQNLNNLFLS